MIVKAKKDVFAEAEQRISDGTADPFDAMLYLQHRATNETDLAAIRVISREIGRLILAARLQTPGSEPPSQNVVH